MLENRENLSALRPWCLLVCVFRLTVFLLTFGSFSFSGISSSSSSATVLSGSLKMLGPVSQSDPVRLRIQATCAQVCRVLTCSDIPPLFGAGNFPDCLYTVSDINIEPLALILDVTEDNL